MSHVPRAVAPRWSLLTVALAVIASVALSAGAYSSVFGSSHGEDEPFYACLYAGSLTQASHNPPASCGRGTMVSWPSYDDFVALQQQLGTDVSDLQALVEALTQRVSDLEEENALQQQAIETLITELSQEAEAREGADQTIQQAVQNQQAMIVQLEGTAGNLADNLADLAALVDDIVDDIEDIVTDIADVVTDISSLDGAVTLLESAVSTLQSLVAVICEVVPGC